MVSPQPYDAHLCCPLCGCTADVLPWINSLPGEQRGRKAFGGEGSLRPPPEAPPEAPGGPAEPVDSDKGPNPGKTGDRR